MGTRTSGKRRRLRERTLISLTLFAFGAFVAWQATGYELGSLRRMGPGYFPLMLGVALCAFAAMIFVSPDPEDKTAEAVNPGAGGAIDEGNLLTRLRAFGFVLGAMIVFAVLIRPAGFAPATIAATCLAGMAEPDNGVRELVLLSVGVTVFASLVFIVALGIPVPVLAF